MAPGLEALLEDQRRPGVHRTHQREAETTDPEQRHRRVHTIAGLELAELREVQTVAHDGAVRVDGALRIGRASRRVHDDHRVGWGDLVLDRGQQVVTDVAAARDEIVDVARPAAVGRRPCTQTLRRYGCDVARICSCGWPANPSTARSRRSR